MIMMYIPFAHDILAKCNYRQDEIEAIIRLNRPQDCLSGEISIYQESSERIERKYQKRNSWYP